MSAMMTATRLSLGDPPQWEAMESKISKPTAKPIAVLYLKVGSSSESKVRTRIREVTQVLEQKIGHDYHVFVFPVQDQETKLEILSPGEVPVTAPESDEAFRKRLNPEKDNPMSAFEPLSPYPDYDSEPLLGLQDL